MNFDVYFQKTLMVIEENKDVSDKSLLDALEMEDVSSSIGAYLILFVPIIFCRIISKTFSANFSNEYIEHKDGTTKRFRFKENVLYNNLWELSESFIGENSDTGIILTVAARSPEFPLINKALLENLDIKTLVFSDLHIIL